MKREIEIKILNVDRNKARGALIKMGAKQVMKRTLFREFYFDHPHPKERKYSSFRLRTEGKEIFLTAKLLKEDPVFDIRDEFEVEVDDFDTTLSLVKILGFNVFRKREKIREEFIAGDIVIEIDEYPGMQPYIEIEGTTKKSVEAFLKKFGFSLEYASNKSATDIIRNAGLDPDNLLFKKNGPLSKKQPSRRGTTRKRQR